MRKKSIIILFTLLAFLFINTISFAEDMKNDAQNMTNTVVDGSESAGEKVKQGVNTIENNVENAVNDTKNAIGNVMNGAENTLSNMGQDMQNTYTASRTSTEGTLDNNYTPWIIIATAVAVIIGLTWYYLTQVNNNHN